MVFLALNITDLISPNTTYEMPCFCSLPEQKYEEHRYIDSLSVDYLMCVDHPDKPARYVYEFISYETGRCNECMVALIKKNNTLPSSIWSYIPIYRYKRNLKGHGKLITLDQVIPEKDKSPSKTLWTYIPRKEYKRHLKKSK